MYSGYCRKHQKWIISLYNNKFYQWKNLKKSEKNLKNTEKIPYIAEPTENAKNTKNKIKKSENQNKILKIDFNP